MTQPAVTAQPDPVVEAWRVKFPVGRAWWYTILSWGGWGAYFVYATRKLFDRELASGRDDAAFHAVGAFIPVLNFFVTYWLWRDLDLLRRRAGLPGFEVVLFLVLTIFGGAPVTYTIVLHRLNEYWDWRSRGWASEARVSTAEKWIVGIGAALWGLFLLLIVLALVLVIALASRD